MDPLHQLRNATPTGTAIGANSTLDADAIAGTQGGSFPSLVGPGHLGAPPPPSSVDCLAGVESGPKFFCFAGGTEFASIFRRRKG